MTLDLSHEGFKTFLVQVGVASLDYDFSQTNIRVTRISRFLRSLKASSDKSDKSGVSQNHRKHFFDPGASRARPGPVKPMVTGPFHTCEYTSV